MKKKRNTINKRKNRKRKLDVDESLVMNTPRNNKKNEAFEKEYDSQKEILKNQMK